MGVIPCQFKIVHMPFLLQSNAPQGPPWGQKKVAVVERWPLWGEGGQAYFL